MKVRNGFVSNSSSSSFLIVCPRDVHEQAKQSLHPFYKAWMDTFRFTDTTFLGKDVVVFNQVISSEDDYDRVKEWDGEYPEGYDKDGYADSGSIIDEYVNAVKKISKDVIYETECC